MSEKTKKTAKTLSTYELLKMFPDEQSAIDYLTKILWPNGPVCPFCGGKKHYVRSNSKQLFCADCRKNFNIRTGTIFQNSKIELHK